MIPKPEQMLRNPDIPPTSEVIEKALKASNSAYLKLLDELNLQNIDLEWHYYQDGKVWLAKGLYKSVSARGGQKIKTIFWLSIWDGFFKITLYIPEKYRDGLETLSLSDEVKDRIAATPQMGKLKFFPVVFDLDSEEQFETVFLLSAFLIQHMVVL